METSEETRTGICHECSVKDGDYSQKKVHHCEICDNWFCDEHRSPKFPYFVDWDTVLNVQGDPEIKALYHTEYKREGGHPDFNYWRKTLEARDIAEKELDRLIKIGLDKMNAAFKERAREREEEIERAKELAREKEIKEKTKELAEGETQTTGNIYGNWFIVPLEVYENATYREYLDHAKTEKSVKVIVDEYYRKYGRREKSEETKKHWWQ
jgi:hypothetical protein